jgi:Septum formation
VVALLLTGCGRPAGVDGDLTNGWPALPDAKVQVPAVGACYTQPYVAVWIGDFHPVPCAQQHQDETTYVGTFPDNSADPPASGSPALASAYAQCQQATNTYLGGDWHSELVELRMVRPSGAAWTGGARWYRCDLTRVSDVDQIEMVSTDSLKGDLTGPRVAAFGCLATVDQGNAVTEATPIDCAQPHGAEFAGVYTAPDVPWPTAQATRDRMGSTGCEEVVATFLGYASVSQWNNSQIGWWESPFDPDQWALGDRAVQCFAYAYTKGHKMIGSVRGIRDAAPRS